MRKPFVILFCLLAAPAFAQTGPDVRLQVTVVDQTRAVIPNATVTITGIEAATNVAVDPAQTSGQGLATIAGLTPGRYEIRAEFLDFSRAGWPMSAFVPATTGTSSSSPCSVWSRR